MNAFVYFKNITCNGIPHGCIQYEYKQNQKRQKKRIDSK